MMIDDLVLLNSESAGNEDTFTFKMRYMRTWDRELFNRLIEAMYRVAQANAGVQCLERHIVYSFYLFATFIPKWTGHPSFSKSENQYYYDFAYTILDDLCNYLYKDQDPYCIYDRGFEEVLSRLNKL